MIRNTILRAISGAFTTKIFSFWYYHGRKLGADSQLWRTDTTFITIDGE